MTAQPSTATNHLSRLVHLPCTSTTSSRPITADAIRTEIIIGSSVEGRYRRTTPKWGVADCWVVKPTDTNSGSDTVATSSAATEGSLLEWVRSILYES